MQNEIYFGRDLISEQDLRHYGMPKRSGRYPWGSGDDPYHHGADGPGGKKSSKSDGPRESYFKRRAAKKAAVAKAKQEKIEREAKEERDRLKQEALKSGDPKKLAPFIRDLSDAELRQASDRLRLENEFANRLSEASKYQKTAADKIQAKLNKLNSYTSTGIDTWNNYAKIANVFRSPEDQLPIIGAEKKKKKDKNKDESGNSGNQNNYNNGSKPAKSEKPEKSEGGSKPENPSKPTESTKPDTQSKSETSSKKSEEDLVNQWREEANKIVEEARREKAAEDRSDFRREMAEGFSNHLKEEAKQKEIDEWVDNVRNEVRKEFRRNQAEEFSNRLREEKERELQKKLRREAEDIELNARRKRDDYEEYNEPTIDLTDYYPDYEIDYSTDTPNLTNTQWRNLVSANGKRLKKKR